MLLTFHYRLLPTKRQHGALGEILEKQRQLYNAAREERVDAYRKPGITRDYIDQCRAPSEVLARGLAIDRDLSAARNIVCRAGVGPGLLNVAGRGMRAGGNLGENAGQF